MTPWTVALQAAPPMGFSKQEYWRGLPFSSLGDLPDPGNEPGSHALQADSLPSEPPGKPPNCRNNKLIYSNEDFLGSFLVRRSEKNEKKGFERDTRKI